MRTATTRQTTTTAAFVTAACVRRSRTEFCGFFKSQPTIRLERMQNLRTVEINKVHLNRIKRRPLGAAAKSHSTTQHAQAKSSHISRATVCVFVCKSVKRGGTHTTFHSIIVSSCALTTHNSSICCSKITPQSCQLTEARWSALVCRICM